MGQQLRLGEAAEVLGIAKTTLRMYTNEGVIPCIKLPSGHRYYDKDVLLEFLHRKNEKEIKKENQNKVFLYGRVSTKKQAESGNLDRQMMRLNEYAIESGYMISGMFKEVASGMNENRRELHKLLEACENNKGSIVLIEYKDRLARFGFSYLETHIQSLDCRIEILEKTEKSEEEELIEDLIVITTSFSARIYGKRGGKKVKEKVQEILEEGVKET